jgi:SAM-dependent methyltransferase
MGMQRIELDELASNDNFVESDYLKSNYDIAEALAQGIIPSGRAHFEGHGRREGRRIRLSSRLDGCKADKLRRLEPLLRTDLPFGRTESCFDFLSDELRESFGIVSVDAVSTWDYGPRERALIERHAGGLVLDAGAGKKPAYYDNVVNLEIVPYDTTDVLGVGEVLPFCDASFDAVISNAVLEHVRDPFRCASEIARVLKPGGELYCVAAFLQPLHGYPNHYFNMSHEGLRSLFDAELEIDSLSVPAECRPIFTLAWMLNSWAAGLEGRVRDDFLGMRVSDLIAEPSSFLGRPFVETLPNERNLELASAVLLTGRKPT